MGLFTARQTTMLETIGGFLREDDWKFSPLEDRAGVRFSVSAKNGAYACIGIVDEDRQELRFYAVSPTNVPEPQRAAVCEFLTRANYGIKLGNFEMDLEDGEVRYKCCVRVEGSQLSKAMARDVVYCAIGMMDRYYAGLMSVLYANTSPREAVAAVEA